MTDVDALFDVFGDGEEESKAPPTTAPAVSVKKEGTKSAVDILKRHREEATESHGEEAKKLKKAVVDELR